MPIRVYLQILCATFLWGSAFSLVKMGLAYAPALGFAAMRFTLAGLMLVAGSLVFGRGRAHEPGTGVRLEPSRAPVEWPRVLLIGLLSTAVFYALFFLGMARTSASSGSVIDGSSPIVASLMAHFILRNDKLTRRKLLAAFLSFAGVALVAFAHPSRGGEGVSTSGCMMIFAGLVVSSFGTLLVITYRGRLGLLLLVGTQMAFGGVLLFVLSALAGERRLWQALGHPRFLAIWVYLSGVSAVAFSIWYSLVRRYKLTSIAPFSSLIALWGALLSVSTA